MTEQNTEQKDVRDLKVGDLGVDQFFAMLLQVVHADRSEGNDKLMDLTVKDFTALMLDQIKNRSLAVAQAEAGTAERILTDWQGLQKVGAVTQPFRIVRKEHLDDFYRSIVENLSNPSFRGEFVVAVAITEAGAYAPHPRR